ncbi:hypothetical protein ACO2Q8_21500 [Larkinella sp. VNQ87]|uniref:hypothetical protein n=1 Tax=Larkinella sp. VNQ87 TaxID=3400921 RepID=UPI003C09902A
MLRILLDEHGGCTNDLFIKIDGTISHVFIADTTWLGDFFKIEDENTEKKTEVALLIHLWKNMLLSDQPTCYLPFDLADQGGSALRITKGKKLYQINPVWTNDLTDGTSETYFLKHQIDVVWKVHSEREWQLAPASILTGLNWSLARLDLPSIPLKYE